jgi:hypothetical protein
MTCILVNKCDLITRATCKLQGRPVPIEAICNTCYDAAVTDLLIVDPVSYLFGTLLS